MKVRYALGIFLPGTNVRGIGVHVGEEFDLALFVQDVRPARDGCLRGVWAAYANVVFNRDLAYTKLLKPIECTTFTAPYVNGRHVSDETWGLGALGAFDGFNEIGSDMLEVARVRMVAAWPGVGKVAGSVTQLNAYFGLRFSDVPHPAYDTLVLGNLAANPPENSEVGLDEIIASGVSLTIRK